MIFIKAIAITENHLYRKAYVGGKKALGRCAVIYILKDKKAYKLKKEHPQKVFINRIGISVTKKIGGAVQRNRAKRVIRAAFAQVEKEFTLKKGFLIVISAREAATKVKATEVYEEMKCQLEKLDMIKREDLEEKAHIDEGEKAPSIAPAAGETVK